jgi:hypothetical protein
MRWRISRSDSRPVDQVKRRVLARLRETGYEDEEPHEVVAAPGL